MELLDGLADGGLNPEQEEFGQKVLAFFDQDQFNNLLHMFGGKAAFASAEGVARFADMITNVVGISATEQCH